MILFFLICASIYLPSTNTKTSNPLTIKNSYLFEDSFVAVNIVNQTTYEELKEIQFQYYLYNCNNTAYEIYINDNLVKQNPIENVPTNYIVLNVSLTFSRAGINEINFILYNITHPGDPNYIIMEIKTELNIQERSLKFFDILLIIICILGLIGVYLGIKLLSHIKIRKLFTSFMKSALNEPSFFNFKEDLPYLSEKQYLSIQKTFTQIIATAETSIHEFTDKEFTMDIKIRRFKS